MPTVEIMMVGTLYLFWSFSLPLSRLCTVWLSWSPVFRVQVFPISLLLNDQKPLWLSYSPIGPLKTFWSSWSPVFRVHVTPDCLVLSLWLLLLCLPFGYRGHLFLGYRCFPYAYS